MLGLLSTNVLPTGSLMIHGLIGLRDSARSHHRGFGALAAAACLLICTSRASAQAPCPDTDFVGVAVIDHSVVLTTRARSIFRDRAGATIRLQKADPLWRFRALPFHAAAPGPISFTLNRSGASAQVSFGTAAVHVVDLTRDILELADEDRYVPRVQFDGDQPEPCQMPAVRLQHLAEQLTDFMEERSGAAMTSANQVTWTFYRVSIDARLYAPFLQLARQETIIPEDFDIWTRLFGDEWAAMRQTLGVTLNADARTTRGLKTIYRRYRERYPTAPASVYFHTEDNYPSSWVIEYWFYYPFDEGGLDEHLHDSEHLFVEVDKLGGIVRRVVGAGHGDWAPNNEYGTFKDGVQEIELPLWAIAEKGKHASAPDIDKDQQLTPGIDTNLYRDVGKVWGIRDATGQTDSALRPFGAAMMTVRRTEDQLSPIVWLAPSKATTGRDLDEHTLTECPLQRDQPRPDPSGLRVLPRPRCYILRPLGQRTRSACDDPTAACATRQIVANGDFKRSHHVLKQGFFPAAFPRLTWTHTPTANGDTAKSTEQSWRMAIGGGAEISAIPIAKGKRLPLPGRLVGQALIDSGVMKGDTVGWFDGFTGHYEILVSNLFSGYVGINWQTDELTQQLARQAHDGEEPGRSLWLSLGGGFERPILGRVSGLTQVGLTFNNFYGLRYEFSIGLAVSYRNNHRRFGIERRAKNPFSH